MLYLGSSGHTLEGASEGKPCLSVVLNNTEECSAIDRLCAQPHPTPESGSA